MLKGLKKNNHFAYKIEKLKSAFQKGIKLWHVAPNLF